ncbi:UDP-N-acetylglucosamine 2-epimerase (non-hydrolyzing) [Candidatus Berkelbacteria bacterium]|nr:UDP-N-acetylglucosamine 2-epimerase (non-hydrolyzing) [Candidatus Berkelbacteria bacterium]
MTLAIILGTRPEVIKLAPVIRAAEAANLTVQLIHTNQHYSERMDRVFFEDLELPAPTVNLGIGSGSHGAQTGRMLEAIEAELLARRPDAVLVQGDTNTVVAGGLAAAKLGIKLGHVEAGLRSYDRSMPEELNRIVVDHLADYLFAPTAHADAILAQEGLPSERRFITGNTVVDTVLQHRALAAERSTVLGDLGLTQEQYLLLTLHRPSNVDTADRLAALLVALADVAQAQACPIVFPAHPRTLARLTEFSLTVPEGIRVIEPGGYLDFLSLQEYARLILTDSGGIQEEACILGVPAVTLRDTTERPETVEVGASLLAGTPEEIGPAVATMLARPRGWSNPFGDGHAAERIVAIVSGTPVQPLTTPIEQGVVA